MLARKLVPQKGQPFPRMVPVSLDACVVQTARENPAIYSICFEQLSNQAVTVRNDTDADGNVWTTDSADNIAYKFSPEGELLLTLGQRGMAGDNASTDLFNRPSDVAFGSAPRNFLVMSGHAVEQGLM